MTTYEEFQNKIGETVIIKNTDDGILYMFNVNDDPVAYAAYLEWKEQNG